MPKKSKQNWGISLFCKATHPRINSVKEKKSCEFDESFTCKYMSTLTYWIDFMCDARTFDIVTRFHTSGWNISQCWHFLKNIYLNRQILAKFCKLTKISTTFSRLLLLLWSVKKGKRQKSKSVFIAKKTTIFSLKLDTDTP